MSSEGQSFRLQVQLTREDYRRFFAIAARRQSTWTNNAIYLGAFALALPVAFAARALAANETGNPADVELAGFVGLIAYFAGWTVFLLAYALQRRLTTGASFDQTPGIFDDVTMVLDHTGLLADSKLSRMHRSWAAFTAVTAENGLVLHWIGPQVAVLLPDRAFPDAATRDSVIAFARAKVAPSQ